ncbi:hypothetical protein SK128_016747 [Halocaridina rubra]|uniref:Uncharacterized protein n=1 Tax=Halocaridina rubra TaxID=373956 RepID=A0AAN8XGT7_HALRR
MTSGKEGDEVICGFHCYLSRAFTQQVVENGGSIVSQPVWLTLHRFFQLPHTCFAYYDH